MPSTTVTTRCRNSALLSENGDTSQRSSRLNRSWTPRHITGDRTSSSRTPSGTSRYVSTSRSSG